MSHNGKVVLGLFFSAVVHVSFGMDGQEAKGSWLWSGIESLTNTVGNYASDDKAFSKLGYSTHSYPDAQKELDKCKELYKTIPTAKSHQVRAEHLAAIARRTAFLDRVLNALPTRGDGLTLATFCIENHAEIMSQVHQNLFKQFIDGKQKESLRAQEVASNRLTKDLTEGKSVELPSILGNSVGLQSSGLKSEPVDVNIFLKIGWAVDDRFDVASIHLTRCLAAYKIKQLLKTAQHFEVLKTVEGRKSLEISEDKIVVRMIEKPDQLNRRIERTGEFIRKIYSLLALRFDSVQLAAHCLKFHTYVMSESLQDDFRSFIQKQTEHITEIATQVLGTSKNSTDADDAKTGQ